MTAKDSDSRYRWYILALGTATHIFVSALPWACMPVLFPEIAADLNLNLVQIGMIWGITSLPGIISMFGGMLGDRFGTAKILTISCLLVCIACALRGTAASYGALLGYTVFFGLAGMPIAMSTHKAAAQWFSPKQLGLANGILAMGMGTGGILSAMISATVMSPLLGGWRNVMFVYAGICIIFAVLWFQTRGRKIPNLNTEHNQDSVPFKQTVLHTIKLKQVWILAFMQLFVAACRGGIAGYLPTYLVSIGWSTVSASAAVSAIAAASVAGVIPISMFSDKIGMRKPVIFVALLMTALAVILFSVPNSAVIWLAVIIIGIFQEALAAVSITLAMEIKGIGATYAGSALGLTTMTSSLGGLAGPPVGNRLVQSQPLFGFVFWAVMAVISAVVILFVKETGWRKNPELKS